MPDYTVQRYGSDSSGRPIHMTRYAWRVWRHVLNTRRVKPFAGRVTIVQGAFMSRAGGGASASAGYHDLAGCWDIRTWNLHGHEVNDLIRECRKVGIAAWRRDAQHGGMDPHIHVVFGDDRPLAGGAAVQWQQYLRGENGLASGGADYEWRPSPLVTKPPASIFETKEWFVDMDAKDEQRLREIIRDEVARTVAEVVPNLEFEVIAQKGKPLLKWPLRRVLRHLEEEQDAQDRSTKELLRRILSQLDDITTTEK